MLAKYAIIVRRAGALTAGAAAVMVAVSAALAGVKGLYGALIGVAIVTVFFGLSVLVVGRAARVSPQAMMVAAMVTYLVKIVALAVVVSTLSKMTRVQRPGPRLHRARLHPGLVRHAGHHGDQDQDALRRTGRATTAANRAERRVT